MHLLAPGLSAWFPIMEACPPSHKVHQSVNPQSALGPEVKCLGSGFNDSSKSLISYSQN